MEQNFTDDTLLARWLSGELTDSELEELKQHPDFEAYQKIAAFSDELEAPELERRKLWKRINRSMKKTPKKATVLTMRQRIAIYTVAALILCLIGFWILTDEQANDGDLIALITQKGERQQYNLPDGSTVNLSPDSRVTYSKSDWKKEERNLKLKGKALFDVKKGSKFTVNVRKGFVEVLGTQFEIENRTKTLEVRCFEGMVKVVAYDKNSILTGGEGVIISPEKTLETFTITKEWTAKVSSFDATPLYLVLEEFERQYNLEVKGLNLDDHRPFTGSFPNDDLELALQKITEPMNLRVMKIDNKSIQLVKKE